MSTQRQIEAAIDAHWKCTGNAAQKMEAALAAAEQAAWEPIETADKNQWYLGATANTKLPVPIFYDEDTERWWPLNRVYKDDWIPTHCQPLPSPPDPVEEGKG
jgi:hypothetical protein